jgi:hypothetical protein
MNLADFLDFFALQVESEIEGWFYPPDIVAFWMIDRIQKDAHLSGSLCELGVYQGKSAIALGRMLRSGETLFCYDIFHEYSIDGFRANLGRFCPDLDNALVCVRQNLPALRIPPEAVPLGGLRFLHVDAVHEHSSVLNDLCNFSPLLARHGVIVLDDYFDPDWPGVSTGMSEFCLSEAGSGFRPFISTRSKMYLCRREWVEFYQTWIVKSGLIPNLSLEGVFDGVIVRCFSTQAERHDEMLGRLTPL